MVGFFDMLRGWTCSPYWDNVVVHFAQGLETKSKPAIHDEDYVETHISSLDYLVSLCLVVNYVIYIYPGDE